MTPTAKTLQIFLPSGDPRGIRIAEITTRIVQVIEVPRSLLPEFLKMPESGQVAVYFLFGEGEDDAGAKVYIGQTGDLRARLIKHNKDKEFWERALVLVSRTNSLTQTHALFLEWYCLQGTRKAARYADENGNAGSKPYTPAPLEADCYEIYETGQTLLATLGYPIFDSVAKPAPGTNQDEIFYCTTAGVEGRGLYTEEGFVVLEGSVGRRSMSPTLLPSTIALRSKLLDMGVVREVDETVKFQRNHLFNSPSSAATALLGRATNGWMEWKDKDGRTLDELKRQLKE